MFYNTKKICVKQITQIFFKLLLITGGLLIVFLRGSGGGLCSLDRRWNRLERGYGPLLLSLPNAHYLATDGYYIQNRNHQEESKA